MARTPRHGRRSSYALALCAAATLLLPSFSTPTLAEAQSPSGEPAPNSRHLFQEAMGELEEGEFAEAARLFRQSLAVEGRPATAFNLAISLRGLGRIRDGISVCEGLLRDDYGALDQRERAGVDELLAQLQQRLGTLSLSTLAPERVNGDPVRILVDQEEVARGMLPLDETLALDPGDHTLTIEGDTIFPTSQPVEVISGETTRLSLPLEVPPEPATLTLLCDDADAIIELEGIATGRESLSREVPPGTYQARVRNAEGEHSVSVVLAEGEQRRLTLDAPRGRRTWWIWVAGAAVLVGGGVALTYWAINREGDPRVSNDFPHVQPLTSPLGVSF